MMKSGEQEMCNVPKGQMALQAEGDGNQRVASSASPSDHNSTISCASALESRPVFPQNVRQRDQDTAQ